MYSVLFSIFIYRHHNHRYTTMDHQYHRDICCSVNPENELFSFPIVKVTLTVSMRHWQIFLESHSDIPHSILFKIQEPEYVCLQWYYIIRCSLTQSEVNLRKWGFIAKSGVAFWRVDLNVRSNCQDVSTNCQGKEGAETISGFLIELPKTVITGNYLLNQVYSSTAVMVHLDGWLSEALTDRNISSVAQIQDVRSRKCTLNDIWTICHNFNSARHANNLVENNLWYIILNYLLCLYCCI